MNDTNYTIGGKVPKFYRTL